MTNNQSDKKELKFKLVKAMLTHVPFDGWGWDSLEQGAVDIAFEKKLNSEGRKTIYQNLFKNGPIDFIDTFSEMIDDQMEESYHSLVSKPDRIPQKIKTKCKKPNKFT